MDNSKITKNPSLPANKVYIHDQSKYIRLENNGTKITINLGTSESLPGTTEYITMNLSYHEYYFLKRILSPMIKKRFKNGEF